jgi:hypothetical protein
MPEEPQQLPNPTDFAEEAIPFDDVVRNLLAAKPVHRKAPDPKAKPDEKPNDP